MSKTPRLGLHGLPARDGVSPSCVGLPARHWPTITDFLIERFPAIAREVWLQRMHDELVVDEFGEKVSAEPLLKNTAGDSQGGYAPNPAYRPLTKFENRGIKLGHGVWDVVFTRVQAP